MYSERCTSIYVYCLSIINPFIYPTKQSRRVDAPDRSDFVHPLAGLLESFALLLIDFVKTLDGHLASLGVGHAEHVVSLDSSINTTVARDWFSKCHDFLLGVLWRAAVESSDCFLLSLRGNHILSCCDQRLSEFFLSLQMLFLLFKGFLGRLASIECILFRSEDWLFKNATISLTI